MAGIFELTTARMMFEHLQKKWVSFCSNPNEELLIDTLFPMYHLREWICPKKWDEYKCRYPNNLTDAEKLHFLLHDLPEYKIIRSLCNKTKHYSKGSELDYRMDVVHGARAGLMRCGDSLGTVYFCVDGVDIRSIFNEVYCLYYRYFSSPPL